MFTNCEITDNASVKPFSPNDPFIILYNNVFCNYVRIYKPYQLEYKMMLGYEKSNTNEFYEKIYPKIYKTVELLPYNNVWQSTREQITLFAPRKDMIKFVKSSGETIKLLSPYYQNILGNPINPNIPIADFYKMYTQTSTNTNIDTNTDTNTEYDYIYQIDPQTLDTLCNVLNITKILSQKSKYKKNPKSSTSFNKVEEFTLETLAERKLSTNFTLPKYIFVPYIPLPTDNSNGNGNGNGNKCNSKPLNILTNNSDQIEEIAANSKHNFAILDEKEFVSYLKSILSVTDVGNIIFQLLDKIKTNYALNELELEYRIGYFPTYGLDKEEIDKLLSITNEYFLHYMNQSKKIVQPVTLNLCNSINDDLIKTLGTAKTILSNYDMFDELYDLLSGCNFKLQELDTMKKSYLTTDTIETCATRTGGPHDTVNRSIITNCESIINKIQDPKIRDALQQRLVTLQTTKNYSDPTNLSRRNITVDKDKLDEILDYDLFIESMPEWSKYMLSGNFEAANESRQLILGKLFNNTILDHHLGCGLIFQTSPFIHNKFMNMLRWNPFINKYMISCLAQKDVIFPIRIIANVTDLIKYPKFTYDPKNHILLGTVITDLPELSRQDHMFIYYDKERGFLNTVNSKGRFAYHYASADNSFMVTYIELSLLMYYEADLGVKLYYYKIKQQETNKITSVLVSRYTLDVITIKYKELGYQDGEIKKILDRLEPVTLKRDSLKNFYYEPVKNKVRWIDTTKSSLKGGAIREKENINKALPLITENTLEINKLIDLETNDFAWDIEFSTQNKVIDKQVFPKKLLRKQIKLIDKLTSLLGSKIGYVCAVLSKRVFLKTYGRDIYAQNSDPDLISKMQNTIGNKQLADLASTFYEKGMDSILEYPFNDMFSIEVFTILKEEDLITNNDKICVISKNVKMLDGIVYYLKHEYEFNAKNIMFSLAKLNSNAAVIDASLKYLEQHEIPHNVITTVSGDLSYEESTEFSVIFIDYILFVKELINFRTNMTLQGLVACLANVLPKLITTGTLYLYIPLITNKLMFDFVLYLSTGFVSSKIITISPETKCTPLLMTIVFKDYKGNLDQEKLINLKSLMFAYDKEDGVNFEPNDAEELKYFNINYQNNNNKPAKYLNKIFNTKVDLRYPYYAYKTYVTNILNSQITYLKTIKHVNKLDDKKFNEQYLANALTYSLGLAVKYDLEISDKFKNSENIKDQYLKLLNIYTN